MGMLIKSLSFGSGSIDRQQLYLIWLDRNGKFENHSDQISHLFENGGWNSLSDIEKDKFVNVF